MNPACGSERAEGEEDTALNSVAVSAERAMDILAATFASRLKSGITGILITEDELDGLEETRFF